MPTQVICRRIRLKEGCLDRVYEWARAVNIDRRHEALATLRDEDVTVESVFLERAGDGDYLIYFMRGTDLERSTGAAATSKHPIDAYHQQFKRETWVGGQTLEMLVDLTL